jgi:2-octaprenyl-6-methoxyphenol hydroxylase
MTDVIRDGREGRHAGAGIVVAGGGIAGLTLALALKHGLGAEIAVTVCDPAFARDATADLRSSAIAAGARRMREVLGVWQALLPHAQPIVDMAITDSRVADPVRPIFLTFAGEVEAGEPFAHMVENGPLLATLRQACDAAGVALDKRAVSHVDNDADICQLTLSDGARLAAHLVAAADGARSPLREAAGIQWISWDYPQAGLVATLTHERDHAGRAYEHFLPSGPFAILPLTRRRSSIVWTERKADVPALLALDEVDLVAEIERRFGLQLGALALETPVRSYPLGFGIARRFVAERLALVGDAAHVIHPIAGQGLNIGLRDAAALAEAVTESMRLGLLPDAASTLERYERARRFDTVAMGVATDVLNRMFSNDLLPLRLIRDLGLGLVDRMPAAKRLFIREAAGLVGAVPRLMRGEAL